MEAIKRLECSEDFIESNFRLNEYEFNVGFGIKKAPMTTSLKVAEVFGKLHKDVLKAINTLACSENFRGRNFTLTEIEVQQNL